MTINLSEPEGMLLLVPIVDKSTLQRKAISV